jgi:NADH-quinone oxidoreductase subunit A
MIVIADVVAESSIVPTSVLVTIFLALVLPAAGVLLAFIAARVLTPRHPTPEKFARFEAGNPPYGRARGLFPMQYYPYLIVFLTVEPLVIYLFLIMMVLHQMAIAVGLLFAGLSIVVAVPLLFALDSARRLELWVERKKEHSG